jgi:hypothetical protein
MLHQSFNLSKAFNDMLVAPQRRRVLIHILTHTIRATPLARITNAKMIRIDAFCFPPLALPA